MNHKLKILTKKENRTLFKYYYPVKNSPGFMNFNIEKCEGCGCETLSHDHNIVYDKEQVLKESGLEKQQPPKQKLIYYDTLKIYLCNNCWIQARIVEFRK